MLSCRYIVRDVFELVLLKGVEFMKVFKLRRLVKGDNVLLGSVYISQ